MMIFFISGFNATEIPDSLLHGVSNEMLIWGLTCTFLILFAFGLATLQHFRYINQ